MRLTLRTMLAYIDNILEPEDSQRIAKRIEESQVASGLMQRIREVTQRLRLGSPSVSDRGEGLDPNTVAEYLDNTLNDTRVPDFERVCFESDVHLAEVASCHQILTLVLGEPAEISPESRQRIYQVPDLLAGQSGGDAAEASLPSMPVSTGNGTASPPPDSGEEKPRSHVPDFLLATTRSRRHRTIAATVLILVAAAAFLFWAVPRVGHFFGSSQKDALVAQENETGVPVDNESARAADESSDRETGNRQVPSGKVAPLPPPEEELPPGKTEPISGRGRAEAATSPPGQDRDLSRRSPTPKAEEGKGLRSPSQDPEMKQPATKDGGDAPLQQPAGVLDPSAPANPPRFSSPEKRAPAAPRRAERLGTVVSSKQVLLRLDPYTGSWRCLQDDGVGVINSTDQLLALPLFRPTISLMGKFRIQLIDGTSVSFQPVGSAGIPTLVLEYGRVIVRTENSSPDLRLRLQLGEQAGVLTFADPHSVVAIDAGRFEDAGGDPETQPASFQRRPLCDHREAHLAGGGQRHSGFPDRACAVHAGWPPCRHRGTEDVSKMGLRQLVEPFRTASRASD